MKHCCGIPSELCRSEYQYHLSTLESGSAVFSTGCSKRRMEQGSSVLAIVHGEFQLNIVSSLLSNRSARLYFTKLGMCIKGTKKFHRPLFNGRVHAESRHVTSKNPKSSCSYIYHFFVFGGLFHIHVHFSLIELKQNAQTMSSTLLILFSCPLQRPVFDSHP